VDGSVSDDGLHSAEGARYEWEEGGEGVQRRVQGRVQGRVQRRVGRSVEGGVERRVQKTEMLWQRKGPLPAPARSRCRPLGPPLRNLSSQNPP